MKIVTIPDPVLETVCSPVEVVDEKIKQLAKQLMDTLSNKGVGLAAPQIGKKKNIFVIGLPDQEMEAFINPQIIDHSPTKQLFRLDDGHHHDHNDEPEPFLEGCLSIPNFFGALKRWPEITAEWLDINGQKQQRIMTNFEAIVFQHELDHLKGILFTKRIAQDGGQLFQEDNGRLKEVSS